VKDKYITELGGMEKLKAELQWYIIKNYQEKTSQSLPINDQAHG